MYIYSSLSLCSLFLCLSYLETSYFVGYALLVWSIFRCYSVKLAKSSKNCGIFSPIHVKANVAFFKIDYCFEFIKAVIAFLNYEKSSYIWRFRQTYFAVESRYLFFNLKFKSAKHSLDLSYSAQLLICEIPKYV